MTLSAGSSGLVEASTTGFAVAVGSVAGRDHRRARRDGQDGFARIATPAVTAAIVTDGCSSGAASEVGARLGAAWLADLIAERFPGNAPYPAAIAVTQALVERLRATALSLSSDGTIDAGAVGEMLLFGFLAAVVTREHAVVFGIGDGIVWVDARATTIDPGPDNAPPYAAYALLGATITPSMHHVSAAADVEAIAIATSRPIGVVHGELAADAGLEGLVLVEGDALVRGANDTRIGQVLAGQTRVRVGSSLGFAFYRAGSLTVAFVFDPRRGVLRQVEAFPPIEGKLVGWSAVFDEAHVLVTFATEKRGHLEHTAHLVDARGALIATDPSGDVLGPSLAGRAISGGNVIVAREDGLVLLRADRAAARFVPVRLFSEAGDFVSPDAELLVGPGGSIFVVTHDDINHLCFTTDGEDKVMLPAPTFYDAQKVSSVYVERASLVAEVADEYRRKHRVQPSSNDKVRIAAFGIDAQIGFSCPGASLFVPGAVEDTQRAIEWLYRNLDRVTQLHFSLDTHRVFQIFHPAWWIDDDGKHPAPFTPITTKDVRDGRYKPVMHPAECLEYVKKLETSGKYTLTIWPYHTLLGGVSHALVPALMEAAMFHSLVRSSQTHFETKGTHAMTENYSVLSPEVRELGGQSVGTFNAAFFKMLMEFDRVYVFGQAKSHCVLSTLRDMQEHIASVDPKLMSKVWVLEDATSPVPAPPLDPLPPALDFPRIADQAFAELRAVGMNLVKTTDPIAL